MNGFKKWVKDHMIGYTASEIFCGIGSNNPQCSIHPPMPEVKPPSADVTNLLADMVFAYVNKDEDMPHNFEIDAVGRACEWLETEYCGKEYAEGFFEKVRKEMENNAE